MFGRLRLFLGIGLVASSGLAACLASPSSDELRSIVAQSDMEALTRLIAKNPELSKSILDNNVPFLVYAGNSGQSNIVELLIHSQVCPQSILDEALVGAVSEGHQKVVRVLLDNGANAKFKPMEGGSPPLHNAALLGNPTIAWMLLQAGADPRVTDLQGRIALHRCKNAVTAYLLVKAGADINAVDTNGWNALHIFATPRENIDTETVRYLIADGIDMNARDKEGLTPLDLAKKNGQNEFIKFLESIQQNHLRQK